MYLSRLTLSDFRNYKQLELPLGPGVFLFHGDNAQGKTNLLEAVSMLATATSFHASSDREVVNWSAPDHVARLDGVVRRREDSIELEILILDPTPPTFAPSSGVTVSPRSIELPAHAPRKRYKVNGAPKRTIDLIGQMKVVMFAPSDLHLVDGGPEERRRFLDRALCQVQPRYSMALVKYRKVVAQRSALLKRIRENQEDPKMLNYLDEQQIQLANQIIYERRRMVDALNEQANHFQQTISGGREQLQIVYRPSFKVESSWSLSEASQQYQEQLREIRKKEIMQGVCLRGPHRDDLEFLVNGVNMLSYGSRGQQRTAALAAKLAELSFMHTSTGDQPILLLDDVFSELDASRREYLLGQVARYEQVMLTSTDLESFPADMLQRSHRYQVVGGELRGED
ncbi:DNA replication/repair protein RecF [Dictyobacter aurantiacus]|uniref:DNA replication and repair protein RecF n=1 Tax=Dictyobacter aurantiacus TaxID=1936993 RepID=A0A401ZCC2_9CHLR|nr:DNA replication/repair protein RecF [Dictyobacter aurantiacus]GCE04482.1 DNA replication and repair protein RecF [Dictyobacter aurantiacus]